MLYFLLEYEFREGRDCLVYTGFHSWDGIGPTVALSKYLTELILKQSCLVTYSVISHIDFIWDPKCCCYHCMCVQFQVPA